MKFTRFIHPKLKKIIFSSSTRKEEEQEKYFALGKEDKRERTNTSMSELKLAIPSFLALDSGQLTN